jgi:predicted ATPase
MVPLLWDSQGDDTGIELTAEPTRWAVDAEMVPTRLKYELSIGKVGNAGASFVRREALAYTFPRSHPIHAEEVALIDRHGLSAQAHDQQTEELASVSGPIKDEETMVSMVNTPVGGIPLVVPLAEELVRWHVSHAIDVSIGAPVRQPVVARVEKRLDADGANLVSVLHTLYTTDRGFRDELNRGMRAAFGDDFDELIFPPAADQNVQLRVRWKSLKTEVSMADLPDGMLRFLYLLVVLGSPVRPHLIAIDEPEIGLHPSMLPIVAEHAVEASRDSQVIFTTHSPQLLDAFTATRPTTTVASCVQGETVLRTRNEEWLEQWLKGYSLGTLFKSGELEDFE